MKRKYYQMSLKDDATIGVGVASTEFMYVLREGVSLEDWTIPTVSMDEGRYVDYQSVDVGWRLCSEKMRHIIDENKSRNDVVEWYEVALVKGMERRTYYILHLPWRPDVLDEENTFYNQRTGSVIRPALDVEVASKHEIFSFPGSMSRIFVSQDMRKAIEKSGCADGISFSQVQAR